jgi:hypothetical protein
MEGKTSSRTKARLIVVTIFAVGFTAGALSMNLYKSTSNSDSKRGGPRHTTAIVTEMTDKLSLSTEQRSRVEGILNETSERYRQVRESMEPCLKESRPRIDAVRQEGRDKIREILTETQRPKFETMVEEQDRKRENWNRDRGK